MEIRESLTIRKRNDLTKLEKFGVKHPSLPELPVYLSIPEVAVVGKVSPQIVSVRRLRRTTGRKRASNALVWPWNAR